MTKKKTYYPLLSTIFFILINAQVNKERIVHDIREKAVTEGAEKKIKDADDDANIKLEEVKTKAGKAKAKADVSAAVDLSAFAVSGPGISGFGGGMMKMAQTEETNYDW